MFKVNNKNTRMTSMTSFWCFYWKLWAYFTLLSSVSIVDFEQANVGKFLSLKKSWLYHFFFFFCLRSFCLFFCLFFIVHTDKKNFKRKKRNKQQDSIIFLKGKIDNCRSSHRTCSIKKAVLKNFSKFTEKYLRRSLFLIKLQTWVLQLY